jgi:hypothetical protein
MKRLFQLALGALVFGAMLLPQPAWAWGGKNRHHAQHHKVRHVKRHHAHRTGA